MCRPPRLAAAEAKPCALDGASLLSQLTFHWVKELLSHKSDMDASDLPGLPAGEVSQNLHDQLAAAWRREQRLRPRRPSLMRALTWRLLLPRAIWGFVGAAAEASCQIAQALLYRLQEAVPVLGKPRSPVEPPEFARRVTSQAAIFVS